MDFLFGRDISSVLPKDLELEYSRKTGKIKNFSIDEKLIGTFRTDGGIALTIDGANFFLKQKGFQSNCVVPVEDAIPFVSEGRSLFVKHVLKCGENVKSGSEVAVVDKNESVLAVGRSLLPFLYYLQSLDDIADHNGGSLIRGIGIKIREGIKSRGT